MCHRCDAAWQVFAGSVDPVRLERERYGRPSSSERPGSPADRVMRAGHELRAQEWRRRRGLADLRAAVAEAEGWRRLKPYRPTKPKLAEPVETPRERLQRLVDADRRRSA